MSDVGHYSIVINQGEDFYLSFYLEDDDGVPIDLTGNTIRGQIRRTYQSGSQLAAFALQNTLSDTGYVQLKLTNTVTSALPSGRWYYDVERVDSSSDVKRLLEGRVRVRPEVTK